MPYRNRKCFPVNSGRYCPSRIFGTTIDINSEYWNQSDIRLFPLEFLFIPLFESWYLYKMVAQNMLRKYDRYLPKKNISDLTDSFDVNKSKYLIYSICAHCVLRYHLI